MFALKCVETFRYFQYHFSTREIYSGRTGVGNLGQHGAGAFKANEEVIKTHTYIYTYQGTNHEKRKAISNQVIRTTVQHIVNYCIVTYHGK